MAEADLHDIERLAGRDNDVKELITVLRKVLRKHGAFITTRIFALVLAPYKRHRFEEKLEVKESRSATYVAIPSALAGVKDIDRSYDDEDTSNMGLDHTILWQRAGKITYITSEPYYVNKKELKKLIERCDKYEIDFQIDAESCYYPGHTVRILFKKGDIWQYDAMQQMEEEKLQA